MSEEAERACLICFQDLTGRRTDARFCSSACRTAFYWAKNHPVELARMLHRFRTETERRCEVCGSAMAGKRYGSRWCGESCRRRAARDAAESRSKGGQKLDETADARLSSAATKETPPRSDELPGADIRGVTRMQTDPKPLAKGGR